MSLPGLLPIIKEGIDHSFYFLPEENEKKIDLTVFETTQEQSSIKISSVHLIVTYDEDSKSIIVAEIINIDNVSRSIFVGTNDISEKIRRINSYSLFPKIIKYFDFLGSFGQLILQIERKTYNQKWLLLTPYKKRH